MDADTGQVGPELAELLGLPFAAAVRSLELANDRLLRVGCEHDDAWVEAEVPLPAVISTAERLCRPAKVDDPEKAAVPAEKIRTITSAHLGDGSWGVAGSPTWVGETKVLEVKRERRILSGALESQVAEAMSLLQARCAFDDAKAAATQTVGEAVSDPDRHNRCSPGTGQHRRQRARVAWRRHADRAADRRSRRWRPGRAGR